jgi:RNA polymerase sigma-70 factor, ECF subfamily
VKQLPGSNVPSEVDIQPATMPDVDPPPVGTGAGVHVVVVSAYETHHAELFSFLARATGDRSAAEGLLQETFVRMAREARAGRAPVEVRAWLYRVAASLVIGSDRRRASAVRVLSRYGRTENDGVSAASPEAGVLGRERAAEMERVLEGLSPDARLALLLSGAGFAGHEIASALEHTAAGTRTLLCRARARVRIRRDLFTNEAR